MRVSTSFFAGLIKIADTKNGTLVYIAIRYSDQEYNFNVASSLPSLVATYSTYLYDIAVN